MPSFTSEWGFQHRHEGRGCADLYVGLVADGSLEKRLAERKLDTLSYYDQITHTRMFSLNRTVREQCRDETRVMTVENPLFMCGADTHATVFEDK